VEAIGIKDLIVDAWTTDKGWPAGAFFLGLAAGKQSFSAASVFLTAAAVETVAATVVCFVFFLLGFRYRLRQRPLPKETLNR